MKRSRAFRGWLRYPSARLALLTVLAGAASILGARAQTNSNVKQDKRLTATQEEYLRPLESVLTSATAESADTLRDAPASISERSLAIAAPLASTEFAARLRQARDARPAIAIHLDPGITPLTLSWAQILLLFVLTAASAVVGFVLSWDPPSPRARTSRHPRRLARYY